MTARWSPPRLVQGDACAHLTRRQADVLDGMCFGMTNAAIGRHLGVSEDTIKTHASRLFRALHARDRAHAVALTVSGQVTVHIRDDYDVPRPRRAAA